jgi:hypothetical protein
MLLVPFCRQTWKEIRDQYLASLENTAVSWNLRGSRRVCAWKISWISFPPRFRSWLILLHRKVIFSEMENWCFLFMIHFFSGSQFVSSSQLLHDTIRLRIQPFVPSGEAFSVYFSQENGQGPEKIEESSGKCWLNGHFPWANETNNSLPSSSTLTTCKGG